MLFFIITWSSLVFAGFTIGSAILPVSKATSFRVGERFIISTWIGLITLAIVFLAISLFTALLPIVGIVTALVLIGIALSFKHTRSELQKLYVNLSPLALFVFSAIEFTAALFFTRAVTWYDTGLYHFQVIQWLSKFGTVPGLALLHMRFGFTSSWLALAAPLNAGIFEMRASAVTGGLALFLGLLHLANSLTYAIKRRARFVDWFLIFASLMYLSVLVPFFDILISPSPDVPLVPIILIIVWSILNIKEQERKGINVNSPSELLDDRLIPVLLSIGAFTIKLSALPCLIIAIVFYILRHLSVNRTVFVGVVVGLLITPGLASSILTSGCPLFPSPFLCVDTLPWSIGREQAANVSTIIQDWNRWAGVPQQNTAFGAWLWTWVKVEKLGTFLIISSLISAAIITIRQKDKIPGKNYVLTIAGLGIALVMYSAPAVRFGLGYLIILPAFLVAAYFHFGSPMMAVSISLLLGALSLWTKPLETVGQLVIASLFLYLILWFCLSKRQALIQPIIMALLCLLCSSNIFNTLRLRNQLPQMAGNLLLPPAIIQPEPGKLLLKQINGFEYWTLSLGEDRCWAAELPCSPYVSSNDIKLRDTKSGLARGFIRSSLMKP